MLENKRNRNAVLALAAITIVLLAGIVYLQSTDSMPGADQNPENNTQETGDDNFTEYASANEETGTTETSGAENTVEVTINEYNVQPGRASIETGDVVQWENTNDFPVYMTFDRTSEEPTIQPGETFSMRFRGITYYKVYNQETEDLVARGSIYVE